jgi:hypothetical protein
MIPFMKTLQQLTLTIFLGCFVLFGPAFAQSPDNPFKRYQSGSFELVYLPLDENQREHWLKLSQKSLASVSKRLGIQYQGVPIRIILTPSDALFDREFQRLARRPPPGWALAVAFSRQRTIIIRSHATRPLTADSFPMTLRHELAHILIGQIDARRSASRGIPRWLNEGLAMWASDQRLERLQQLEVSLLAKSKSLPRFRELEDHFPPHSQDVHRAYLQSLSYLEWIEDKAKLKEKSIADLCAELSNDVPLDNAIFRVTWTPDPEFEWRYQLQTSSNYAEYLLRSFTLWQAMALLAIVAFIRHILKSRRIKRKLTAEDELEEAIWDANYGGQF